MKFLLMFIAIIGLVSCNNDTTASAKTRDASNKASKNDLKQLNDFLKKCDVSSQVFTINSDKPTKVTGKKGTIISVNPAELETENGQVLGKNIKVELKELTNQGQLLRAKAQTVSNGKLLASGGAYYINMTSDGQQLRLKKDKSLDIQFPKLTDKRMSLFYGQRDDSEQMNWLEANKTFENKTPKSIPHDGAFGGIDSVKRSDFDNLFGYIEQESNKPLTAEDKKRMAEQDKTNQVAAKLYEAMKINQLGWINCDRFMSETNTTTLQIAFDKKNQVNNAVIYLVFEEINSVLQSSYLLEDSDWETKQFVNIPIGSKTKIIALSMMNGKLYSSQKRVTIKDNKPIELSMNETSESEAEKLFDVK